MHISPVSIISNKPIRNMVTSFYSLAYVLNRVEDEVVS